MTESDRPASEPQLLAETTATLRSIAGYRLLRKIGQGGMSAVYQSYDVAAQRPVAVKILADHLAGQPEFVGRFYREARLSRVLEHPRIVQGYAAGFDAEVGKHYLVLEFIDGPTAHEALTHIGRLSVGVVVQIGIDMARALAFLHERQYVHRDVKPDNILLHPDGHAKLADLGLAKRLNDDSQLTSIHQGVGTTYYMPYEQAVNANLVDGRSDIFALGASLYHLLTGDVPFPGATHDEVIREKWQGSFRPLRELNPSVPPAVAQLIEATLACDPRARIQRAEDLAAALVATGLATPLPMWGHASWNNSSGAAAGHDESPTRVDHAPPAAPPGNGSATAGFMPLPSTPQTPDAARRYPWSGVVGVGVGVVPWVAAALGNVWT
ncbi:MAG: serine/threonine-protein kinase [Gemmataceae bacterium]|nr:serine/threonine protein kinase [Gemmata sp.]MDW8198034.1 serine/threonine-protein kinase [Gemmataceae bacterium]